MSAPASRLGGRPAIPLNELALVLSIVLVFVLTGLIDRNHTYFTNFQASFVIILRNTVLLGIIALGAAVVIISGGIDLSAGSMVAFSATTCALVMVLFAEPSDKRLVTVSTLGCVCAIAAALASGFLVGTLHAWLSPPFACRRLWRRWPRSWACAALPARCANTSPRSAGAASISKSTSTRLSSFM